MSPFNGKKKKFPLLWSNFKAACNVKDCAKALEAQAVSIFSVNYADVLDISTNKEKAKKRGSLG